MNRSHSTLSDTRASVTANGHSHTDADRQPFNGRPCVPPLPHRLPEHKLRMRLLLCAVIASMAAALPACSASKPDVDVSLEANPHWGNLMYNIQATADDVTIRDVVVNRGSCHVPPDMAAQLSSMVNLKFGQTWRGYSPNCKVDNVKELTVTTGRGTFTFSF